MPVAARLENILLISMNTCNHSDNMVSKKAYVAPSLEVIRMECEGAVICASGVGGSGSDMPFETFYDTDLANEIESLTEMLSE